MSSKFVTSFDAKSISDLQIIEMLFGSKEKFEKLYESQNDCLQFGMISLDKSHCLETFNLIYKYLINLQETESFRFSMDSEYVALLGLFHHIFQNEENEQLKKKGFIFWKILDSYDEFIMSLFGNALLKENKKISMIENMNLVVEQMNQISEKESDLIQIIENKINETAQKKFTEFSNKRVDFIKEFRLNADYNLTYNDTLSLISERAEINTVENKIKQLGIAFKILFFSDIYSGYLHLINKTHLSESEKKFIPRISHFILRIFVNAVKLYSIGEFVNELKDLAFKNYDPDRYEETERLFNSNFPDIGWIAQVEQKLSEICQKFPKDVKILKRKKSIYSAYLKSLNYKKPIQSLWDLYAFRLIIGSFKDDDCEDLALAVLMNFTLWSDKDKAFVNYVDEPKDNGYKSIHIVISNEKNDLIEIQIRTVEMNEEAEYGTASHRDYKDQTREAEGLEKFQKHLKHHQVKEEDYKKHFANTSYFEEKKVFYEKIATDKGFEEEIEKQIKKLKNEVKIKGQQELKLKNKVVEYVVTVKTYKWIGQTESRIIKRKVTFDDLEEGISDSQIMFLVRKEIDSQFSEDEDYRQYRWEIVKIDRT